MSIDRYKAWCDTHHITYIDRGNWLELPDYRVAVVLTTTPPITPGAIEAACRRVTNPNIRILLESWGTPYGELIWRRDDRESKGPVCWVFESSRPVLRRVVPRT